MIILITMITAAILIIINSFIITKDNGNDKEYEKKNALNKDKKYLKTYKKIESMWMITLSSNNYNNNK